ncbi:RNA pseudouridine synthase [Sandaracinobacter sp. RS1-74]|uniref:RluA family pseudouridine synthase n=1 Tax=Sandaracinobacteroides sayramensis TaxID=2913411 RepID=UPI001EDB84A0|nr:RNA pseudouridine synthase [Sandaracinobacteroides sayramensis]MCG2840072.1 RNA pseudouridine synthase [Sandaracinobacteroides sayramensis]
MSTPISALPPILLDAPNWLVIDKPAGLAVHPGPRTPRSLEDILPGYAPNRPAPQAVHRLDRDTSGCLLLARRASALRALSRQFETGQVKKLYWALVDKAPADDRGEIDAPLLKQSSRADGWRMIVSADGKPARTRWEVLQRQGATALIAFQPETGRTHQIRVHATLLATGSAIWGDPVYGQPQQQGVGGMMLHARALEFDDPATNARRRAEAPLPARFQLMGFTG